MSVAVRVTLLVGVTAAAYRRSLGDLLAGLGHDTPLAYLGLVPFLCLGLALVLGRPRAGEPPLPHRHFDVMVAVPLLAFAWWLAAVLPQRLSYAVWTNRLDVLGLPLFVAGLTALLFGARVLWRVRLPVTLLLAAWPWPYERLWCPPPSSPPTNASGSRRATGSTTTTWSAPRGAASPPASPCRASPTRHRTARAGGRCCPSSGPWTRRRAAGTSARPCSPASAPTAPNRPAWCGWVHGILREQSPQTVADFVRQRRRWFTGVLNVVRYADVQAWIRVPLGLYCALWSLSWLSVAFTVANLGLGLATPPLTAALGDVTFGTFVALYLLGLHVNLRDHGRLRFWQRAWRYGAQVLLVPAFGVLEGIGVLAALLRPEPGFHVIAKDAPAREVSATTVPARPAPASPSG